MSAQIVVMPDVRAAAEAENEARDALPKLWNAIVAHTSDDSMFWIGEILLSEITKETGYAGPSRKS